MANEATQPDQKLTSSHTPGPWRFEPHNLYQSDFNGMDEDYPIGYISTSPLPVPIFALEPILEFGYDTQVANAKLIAAAPELLAALKHILAAAQSLPLLAHEEACTAIAKAEGRL